MPSAIRFPAFALQSRRLLLLLAAGAILVAVTFGLLAWSSSASDEASLARQERLLALVVKQIRAGIAHDQESVTVWDDAVQAVHGQRDAAWIDANLGSWMHTYFGHDGAYVLDPDNRPIYAFADDHRAQPPAFETIRPIVAPLVKRLRAKMRSGDDSEVNDKVLSPGASDIALVRGHPAVVSVKPIVSDTGKIRQVPGREFLHVAVRYLDGSFLAGLHRDYMFNDLRFSWSGRHPAADAAYPLSKASGRTVGYFVWKPYRPGSAVMARIAPVLSAVLLIVLGTVGAFAFLLRARSLKLSASEAKLQHMALHDALTGLPNRAMFDAEVDDALLGLHSKRSQGLLFLDLDRFKQVNDTLGHPVGDKLIQEFAARLVATVGDRGLVARMGGDEFTVLVRDATACQEVEDLCAGIVDSVRRPFDIDGNRLFAGVSIGMALAPADAVTRPELMRKADVALYHAKTTGRNRYAVFGDDMDALLKMRQEIEADLRSAIGAGDGQIEVHYQPLFDARSGEPTGCEALIRWKHPTRGWISPELFIPIAEESGLIEQLGEKVLTAACGAAAGWNDKSVAVNVSGVELANPSYAARVAQILLATGLRPGRLEIEVTETVITDNSGSCEKNIDALKELGVRIALDDFGTGFSSLSRLRHLKVDRIKIDKSFIQGFGVSADNDAIVRAIVELAHAKSLQTTAEGVETDDQRSALGRLGCDTLQGFLLSRPVRLKEASQLLGGPAKQAGKGGVAAGDAAPADRQTPRRAARRAGG